MRIFCQYRRAIILSFPLLVACSHKNEPTVVPAESPAHAQEYLDSSLFLSPPAVADSETVVSIDPPLPVVKPKKASRGGRKAKRVATMETVALTLSPTIIDSIAAPHPVSLPMLPEELLPYILALYHDADSLVEIDPELAMVKINQALRFCDDGALYTLAARIVCIEKDLYRCQVLSERGFVKASSLNPDAHPIALKLLIQALQEMRKEFPSSNLEAKYNRAVLAYQLRYQGNPENQE